MLDLEFDSETDVKEYRAEKDRHSNDKKAHKKGNGENEIQWQAEVPFLIETGGDGPSPQREAMCRAI